MYRLTDVSVLHAGEDVLDAGDLGGAVEEGALLAAVPRPGRGGSGGAHPIIHLLRRGGDHFLFGAQAVLAIRTGETWDEGNYYLVKVLLFSRKKSREAVR